MTSQVEVPPLTGLIHFISGKRRVKNESALEYSAIMSYSMIQDTAAHFLHMHISCLYIKY